MTSSCWISTERLQGFPHDVLLAGHTHQMFCEPLGSTQFNHTCAIMSLPEMEVEVFGLSGEEPVKVWNWGVNQARGGLIRIDEDIHTILFNE